MSRRLWNRAYRWAFERAIFTWFPSHLPPGCSLVGRKNTSSKTFPLPHFAPSWLSCSALSLSSPTVEELTCLAAWKDGNARYLVGLVSHNHATSNEERFRCFVYEKTNNNKYGEWACKRGNLLSQSCLIELTLTSSFFHHFQSRISAITVAECRKRKQRRRRWI